MTPSIDDRLASVIRALTEVVLPHLPPEASLAQEQAQLAIGHLQILRAQIDLAPDFEREETDDYVRLATALSTAVSGGPDTRAATDGLAAAIADTGRHARERRRAVNGAIEVLIDAVRSDGDEGSCARLTSLILEHEHARTQKDRLWCVPFGFDSL